jgi:hypothetical protein
MGLWLARSLWRFTPLGATVLIDAPRLRHCPNLQRWLELLVKTPGFLFLADCGVGELPWQEYTRHLGARTAGAAKVPPPLLTPRAPPFTLARWEPQR